VRKAYRFINLLSIDVAIGAVVCAAFFARVLNVTVLPQGYVILGLVVWLIYTADHLLDAWSMKEAATSERHLFHQKNFLAILFAAIVLGIVALGLMFLIRVQLITAGIVFGIFVIAYLLVNRWLKYFKELVGSVLYTGGVLLPSWSLLEDPMNQDQQLYISIFAVIALTNMLIFAFLSRNEDIMDKQKSIATILGESYMKWLIRFVIVSCFGLILLGAVYSITPELIVFIAMELILALIFELKYFYVNDRYRMYGDAIFLLPAIALLF
jgi:hypothetical protein